MPCYLIVLWICAWTCLTGCCPRHYFPSENPDPPEPFCVPERIRVALVLGSGGVRGIAHVGVLEELVKAGIPIDLIVGCSAGSLIGALYADNPDIETVKEEVWSLRAHSIFDIDIWRCRYGLSQGRLLQQFLKENLCAKTFDQLQIPLVAVATDLHTGELVSIGAGDLAKAIQASCSIPFVFVPCEHNGRILIDGAVINPVPVQVARDLGANLIIAVDLGELLSTTIPTNLFQIASRSVEIASLWQSEGCTAAADVVIRPKTCGVGIFNDEMKELLYEAGCKAASEQLPRIKRLLARLQEAPPSSQQRTVLLPPYLPTICQDSTIQISPLSQ